MIEVLADPWQTMVSYAESTYPRECCGAMLGGRRDGRKVVITAVPLPNSFAGEQGARYEISNDDLLAADRAARSHGLELLGIFHSHPDCDAYFSTTDLQNSCPWFSFIVLSIQQGRFHHANSFLPDLDQTHADKEELVWPST